MHGAGYNKLNGADCNRNKMCFNLCFNLSEVFEPAFNCSFARVRAKIERGDPEEFITIILLKSQASERIFIIGIIKPESSILVCYVRYLCLNSDVMLE